MIAKKGYGRAFLQKGTSKIYDQLEHKVPFPHAQRSPLAKGGLIKKPKLAKKGY